MKPISGLSLCLVFTITVNLLGCETSSSQIVTDRTHRQSNTSKYLQHDQKIGQIIKAEGIHTAGIGVIKGGELVWSGYYGQQNPTTPANSETMFNVASITKSVVAETVLKLVGDNKLSLDEPMYHYWVDPDLKGDPRHKLLTPRMVITHTTGFPNWRFMTESNQLQFEQAPGEAFSYSGEGFEYLAKFIENKLGQPFELIVEEQMLKPLQLEHAAFAIREEHFSQMAQALQADGSFKGHYCRPNGWCRETGNWSAADDLAVNVGDYATFMIAAMDATRYPQQLMEERNHVQSSSKGFQAVDCSRVSKELCPLEQGYGMGWQVLDYGDYQVIGHGGSDWSETALAYFYTDSKDGIIVFLNAPGDKGVSAMSQILAVIDEQSPYVDLYQRINERRHSTRP